MRYINYPYMIYPYYHPQGLVVNSDTPAIKPQDSFPPVNIDMLNTSAQRFQELMQQANLLIEKIVTNPAFAYELMEAAQRSNKEKVDELILSTGITIETSTSFHPFGIRIKLDNAEKHGGCCNLIMALSW